MTNGNPDFSTKVFLLPHTSVCRLNAQQNPKSNQFMFSPYFSQIDLPDRQAQKITTATFLFNNLKKQKSYLLEKAEP